MRAVGLRACRQSTPARFQARMARGPCRRGMQTRPDMLRRHPCRPARAARPRSRANTMRRDSGVLQGTAPRQRLSPGTVQPALKAIHASMCRASRHAARFRSVPNDGPAWRSRLRRPPRTELRAFGSRGPSHRSDGKRQAVAQAVLTTPLPPSSSSGRSRCRAAPRGCPSSGGPSRAAWTTRSVRWPGRCCRARRRWSSPSWGRCPWPW